MVAQLDKVLVFRTSIHDEAAKQKAAGILGSYPGVEDWSVDLEDVDRVLRIVSGSTSAAGIIAALASMGIECAELE